jgi:hypothetical protein
MAAYFLVGFVYGASVLAVAVYHWRDASSSTNTNAFGQSNPLGERIFWAALYGLLFGLVPTAVVVVVAALVAELV